MQLSSFKVQYAASNRASCKVCKGKIDKEAIRIGTLTPHPNGFDILGWAHLTCFKMPKGTKQIDVDQMEGVCTLKPDDKREVAALLASLAAAATAPPVSKRSRKDLEALASLDPKRLRTEELKEAIKSAGGSTSGSKTELVEQVKRAPVELRCTQMTMNELKEELELNDQKKTGNKPELIERCVDGTLYGAIPRCSVCGGGRLACFYPREGVRPRNAQYSCPGYWDDDHHTRCSFRGSAEDVQRRPWEMAAATTTTMTTTTTTTARTSATSTVHPIIID